MIIFFNNNYLLMVVKRLFITWYLSEMRFVVSLNRN